MREATGRQRRARVARKGLWGAACAALLAVGAPLLAQSSDDDNARRHFESGRAYLDQGDYENSLREFQASYALSKRSALLLNIAAVHERLGHAQPAIDALTQYLAAEPSSPEKGTIEARIANLKKRLEASRTDAGATATVAPAGSASSTPVGTASPGMSATAGPVGPRPAGAAPGPNRTAAYVSLGVGGAAAIGAVVTGLIANGKYSDAKSGANACANHCPDATVNDIKSMALVSDVFTGVAVAGLGVGAVLFFTAKPAQDSSAHLSPSRSAVPLVSGGVDPRGARVEATWHF